MVSIPKVINANRDHNFLSVLLILFANLYSKFNETVSQDFLLLVLLSESSSPKPLIIAQGSLQIF